MNAFIDSLFFDDNETKKYFMEFEIMQKRFEHEMLSDEAMYFEAEEEENTAKKEGVLSAIVRKIKEFIASLKQKISGFFTALGNSVGTHVTAEMYIQSGAAEVRMQNDIAEISKQIDEEILAERKGVQAIAGAIKKFSSKTGIPADQIIDAKAIAGVVDKVNNFVEKDGGKMLSAAAATGIAMALSANMKKGKELTNEIDKLTNDMENRRKAVHAAKIKDYDAKGQKIWKAIEQLTYACSKTIGRTEKYYYAITKPINEYKANYEKAKRREARKS